MPCKGAKDRTRYADGGKVVKDHFADGGKAKGGPRSEYGIMVNAKTRTVSKPERPKKKRKPKANRSYPWGDDYVSDRKSGYLWDKK